MWLASSGLLDDVKMWWWEDLSENGQHLDIFQRRRNAG
jgi:hypothetical protein